VAAQQLNAPAGEKLGEDIYGCHYEEAEGEREVRRSDIEGFISIILYYFLLSQVVAQVYP